ncbi:uncharacterized protein [Rutidosis leptorrhynchoides]|uniref:uncharacterized protein n=1 Tax=Rutidosis leptorrhynchoides TaxID=125765 RepID=UPI003A99E580
MLYTSCSTRPLRLGLRSSSLYKARSKKEDSWRWNSSSNGIFTVKKLSTIIEEQVYAEAYNHGEVTIRNALVPNKVEIFVWRTLKKRLPVRTELDKKGIDLDSVRCPLCEDDIETMEHSFVFCSHAQEVWNRVYRWWNLGNYAPYSINEMLRDFPSQVGSATGSRIWQAVVWVSAYLIWKNRNNMVFRGKRWNAPVALNEIQVLSFDWISGRAKGVNIDWNDWISNPSIYLA